MAGAAVRRHTGLTLAAQSGATIAELQARAGHSTPSTVMLYQHATEVRDTGHRLRHSPGCRDDAPFGTGSTTVIVTSRLTLLERAPQYAAANGSGAV